MNCRLSICVGFCLIIVIAGGDLWRRADNSASERAQWLDATVPSEDDTIGMSLSAGGVFDRDVFVSFYVFGEEDRAAEDLWVETLAHGNLAEEFYQQGFRRIRVSDSKGIFRSIEVPAPRSLTTQKKVVAEPWAWNNSIWPF